MSRGRHHTLTAWVVAIWTLGCQGDIASRPPETKLDQFGELSLTLSSATSERVRSDAYDEFLSATYGRLDGRRGNWCKLVALHCDGTDCVAAWPRWLETTASLKLHLNDTETRSGHFVHEVTTFSDAFPAHCHDYIAMGFSMFVEYHGSIIKKPRGLLWDVGDALIGSCTSDFVSPLRYGYRNFRIVDAGSFVRYLSAINPDVCMEPQPPSSKDCRPLPAQAPEREHAYAHMWVSAGRLPAVMIAENLLLTVDRLKEEPFIRAVHESVIDPGFFLKTYASTLTQCAKELCAAADTDADCESRPFTFSMSDEFIKESAQNVLSLTECRLEPIPEADARRPLCGAIGWPE